MQDSKTAEIYIPVGLNHPTRGFDWQAKDQEFDKLYNIGKGILTGNKINTASFIAYCSKLSDSCFVIGGVRGERRDRYVRFMADAFVKFCQIGDLQHTPNLARDVKWPNYPSSYEIASSGEYPCTEALSIAAKSLADKGETEQALCLAQLIDAEIYSGNGSSKMKNYEKARTILYISTKIAGKIKPWQMKQYEDSVQILVDFTGVNSQFHMAALSDGAVAFSKRKLFSQAESILKKIEGMEDPYAHVSRNNPFEEYSVSDTLFKMAIAGLENKSLGRDQTQKLAQRAVSHSLSTIGLISDEKASAITDWYSAFTIGRYQYYIQRIENLMQSKVPLIEILKTYTINHESSLVKLAAGRLAAKLFEKDNRLEQILSVSEQKDHQELLRLASSYDGTNLELTVDAIFDVYKKNPPASPAKKHLFDGEYNLFIKRIFAGKENITLAEYKALLYYGKIVDNSNWSLLQDVKERAYFTPALILIRMGHNFNDNGLIENLGQGTMIGNKWELHSLPHPILMFIIERLDDAVSQKIAGVPTEKLVANIKKLQTRFPEESEKIDAVLERAINTGSGYHFGNPLIGLCLQMEILGDTSLDLFSSLFKALDVNKDLDLNGFISRLNTQDCLRLYFAVTRNGAVKIKEQEQLAKTAENQLVLRTYKINEETRSIKVRTLRSVFSKLDTYRDTIGLIFEAAIAGDDMKDPQGSSISLHQLRLNRLEKFVDFTNQNRQLELYSLVDKGLISADFIVDSYVWDIPEIAECLKIITENNLDLQTNFTWLNDEVIRVIVAPNSNESQDIVVKNHLEEASFLIKEAVQYLRIEAQKRSRSQSGLLEKLSARMKQR